MANKNYKTGVRFEYLMVNLLKKYLPAEKYTVIRTAGSHSAVDVVVLEHRGRKYFGIQCKSKKVVSANKT